MFTNKTLLITGGTGSFGNMAVKKFLNTDIVGTYILYIIINKALKFLQGIVFVELLIEK